MTGTGTTIKDMTGVGVKGLRPMMFGLAVILVSTLLPPMGGITPQGWKALGILIFAIVFWASEVVEPAVTGVAILVLLPMLGILAYDETFLGMGTVMIWRLVGIFMVTEAIQKVGLDKRIAYKVLLLARGNVKKSLFLIVMLSYFFVFVVPGALSRTLLLATISLGILKAVDIHPPSNVGKFLFIAIPVIGLISSSSVIVGASVEVYAVTLFDALLGVKWTYFPWMIVNMPIGLITTVIVYFLLLRLFPPEIAELPGGKAFIEQELKQLGVMGRQEKLVLVLFIFLLFLWFADLSEKFPAELFMALVLFFPGLKVLEWKKSVKMVNWDIIILFGASTALAVGLQKSNVVAWMAEAALQGLGNLGPVGLALAVAVLTALIRLGMSSMTATVATLLPLVIIIANKLGINPTWLGMVCVVSSSMAFFIPSQSPNTLVTYAYGYYSARDLLRAALWLAPVYIFVSIALAYWYWPLVNLPLR
ncbi:SLC13 family permease [Candidatus Formimonas warabiya]|uniref:Sodium-dependent dicarboxylate transporter SdcS n=1 Tax=Formimonas warabiya TaxID=1761012 RepID=A0A3G1KY89_FORW1|nr:DASS family sodium-coupled anion symporter [Candidatus Formimonas warabiya]ATW27175.1 hypothetical protein DCMF_22650 [Candidatus Formimonas warabiya]